jgi:hypothetical protein
VQKSRSLDQRARLTFIETETAMVTSSSSWPWMASKVLVMTPSKPMSSAVRWRFIAKLEPVRMAAPAGLWLMLA